jgi:hypothetical protein
MSTHLHLDSGGRDVQVYPNPANFIITAKQLDSWFPQGRTVRAYPQEIPSKQPEFVTSLKLLGMAIPYSTSLINQPFVYVNLHTQRYNDKALIATIGNAHGNSTFVCEYDKIQNNSSGDPAFIHYKCAMTQVMRWNRNDPTVFQIELNDGSILIITDSTPPTPPALANQIQVTFEITPYIRDGTFDNWMTTTYV